MHIDGSNPADLAYQPIGSSSWNDLASGVDSGGSLPESTLGSDAISGSPLTYFGGVVTQIGQAMIGADTGDGDGSADMSKALELLEGVIGLMSGLGGAPSGELLPATELPSLRMDA